MKTIDDLIRELDSPQLHVKTASASAEVKQNPVSTEGANMGLLELYNSQYGDASVKTASASYAEQQYTEQQYIAQQQQQQQQQHFQKTAEEVRLEKLGSASREVFDAALNDYLFKFAAEDIANREANAMAGVGDPQLPVNRPADASAPINTTPQYHDEMYQGQQTDQQALMEEIADVVNARTHGGVLNTSQELPDQQLG
jgi:hypothetical protein